MAEHFSGTSEQDRLKDRMAGCLLGVAIGDALGAPFEHLPAGETARLLEPTGGRVVDFHGSWNGPKGGWTDDTCLTLAACRGLLEAARTGRPIPSALQRALRQAGADPGFRKPGRTILHAVHTGFPDVEAWTNGALMRIAPAAVYAASAKASRTEAAHLALFLARLTHGHPLAVFPAVECALALLSILRGDDRVPDDLIDLPVLNESIREQHRYEEYREVRTRPMKALPPSTGLWMWRLVFEHLLKMAPGKPWDRLPPFEEGLIRVVSDSYDRDTAGAVAGALLGAYWGASRIPERWVSGVERAADILQTAEEMAETVRPREGAFTAVAAANALRTKVHRFRLDPGRTEDGLTARMACLQSQWEEKVASGRVGFALLILPETSAKAGRILVLSSKEPVTSFDWMAMNPHLPWKTWEKAARLLEEWKDLPAYSPMGALFSESRFRCAGSFSDRGEHVIWEASEPGVLPMVLLDGRWAEPDGGVLCHLEIAPTQEDLPGNRIVRLEERCVQVMERILDDSDLPPDPREASFLLDAFRRKAGRETAWEDLEVVSRFWWAALELLQADLYGTLAALAERSSVWEETARHLARVPKDRLLEVFRILRSSPQEDARRLAVRIGIALGDDAPWTDLLDLLDDPDPRVRADTLHGLDSLDAPAVNSFLGANAAIRPPDASVPPEAPSRKEARYFRLKELLIRIGEDSTGHGRGGWEQRPYLRASLCRLFLRDPDDAVRSAVLVTLQDEKVWRLVARELLPGGRLRTPQTVTPAQAGVQELPEILDPRFRGEDEEALNDANQSFSDRFPGSGGDLARFLAALSSRKTESARRLAARLLALVGSLAPEEAVRGIWGNPDPSAAGEFLRAVRSLKEDEKLWNEKVPRPYPAGWLERILESGDESLMISALDVADAFLPDETLAEKIEALADPHRPRLSLAVAGALASFPGGIPGALRLVENLLREGSEGLGEEVGRFLMHRLAVEESRTAIPALLRLLDSEDGSVSEAAAYVLAWAGDESVIPHLERASQRHGNRPLIRQVRLALQGEHEKLSASMGFFRARNPLFRRLIDRARTIHEQRGGRPI